MHFIQKIFLTFALLICCSYTLEIKSAEYFLEKHRKVLESYYNEVKIQSLKKEYLYFRHRKIIEHSAYLLLKDKETMEINGGIVLTNFILKKITGYSNLGGISILGILSSDKKNKESRIFYLKFDGRYLSDLEFLGIGSDLFAYCVLPNFNQCILLGIGENF